MADYDIIGNIAIIKSEENGKPKTKGRKMKEAKALLEKGFIKTVVEKLSNVKGRLRTINTKHLAGEKTLVAEHKENDCRFKFNISTCYFSPRLSGERKAICDLIKSKDNVLVMFAGVGVYPIVIYKYKKPKKIIGIELGKDCCKYFKENLRLNKISEDNVEIIQGDVKRKIKKDFGKFDVVIMARPNLKESFLEQGLNASKKGTKLIYYGFCHVDNIEELIEGLIKEAESSNRKIKLKKVIKAGDTAPYKYRWRIEFDVLN